MRTSKKYKILTLVNLLLTICAIPSIAQLDNTFGSSGKVILPFGTGQDNLSTIKINSNNILISGTYDNSGKTDIGVLKLNSVGAVDNTFGTLGKSSITISTHPDLVYSMDMQSDGKIVLGGDVSYNGTTSDFASVNLNTNGSLNTTFDTDGIDTCIFSNGPSVTYSTKVVGSDKILLLGITYNIAGDNYDYALAKLNTDGTHDLTFNSTGKFTYSIDTRDYGRCLGVQSDGKIIIGGYSSGGFVAIRVNTNGTIDNTFGSSGKKIVVIGTTDEAYTMAIQNDDKIILAGKSGSSMAVVRLNSDGSTDVSFGTNGIKTITEGTTSVCNSVVMDQNNKIVLAGYTFNGTRSDVLVVRLNNADGSEDGRGIIQVGIGNSVGKSVLIDANNKIVIGCSATTNGTTDDYAVVRLNDVYVTGVLTSTDVTKAINLFPNPASQNINVHSVYNIEEIRVVDVLGNEVMNVTNSGNTQLDISSLPKGLYNFVITTDKGTGNKKVSVQ